MTCRGVRASFFQERAQPKWSLHLLRRCYGFHTEKAPGSAKGASLRGWWLRVAFFSGKKASKERSLLTPFQSFAAASLERESHGQCLRRFESGWPLEPIRQAAHQESCPLHSASAPERPTPDAPLFHAPDPLHPDLWATAGIFTSHTPPDSPMPCSPSSFPVGARS